MEVLDSKYYIPITLGHSVWVLGPSDPVPQGTFKIEGFRSGAVLTVTGCCLRFRALLVSFPVFACSFGTTEGRCWHRETMRFGWLAHGRGQVLLHGSRYVNNAYFGLKVCKLRPTGTIWSCRIGFQDIWFVCLAPIRSISSVQAPALFLTPTTFYAP